MVKLILLFLAVFPLFGQNSITVTASRTASTPADLVAFNVEVLTDLESSRDEVLSTLQGSMLTAANFFSVRTVQQYLRETYETVNYLDWTFVLTAPIGNFKSTTSQLTALQQTVAEKKPGMSLSFSVQGTQISSQAAQALTCSTSDLIADARAQAQKMAAAAGAAIGSVLAMSGMTASPGSAPYLTPFCSLTVKFALAGL